MAQDVKSGAFSYVNFGFESVYGTVAGSFPRTFGQGTKISISRKNNMERTFGLGARNAAANNAKKYEGTASIDFVLSMGSFIRAVLGSAPVDAGSSPYTHTFSESNTLQSFSVNNAVELGTNDYVSSLIGVKVNSATITSAVDELAKVRLECVYRTETLATTGISSAVAQTEEPFSFAYGTLSVAGTPIGFVQSVELTVTNNVEMVWGLGSRYSTAGAEKTRTYDFRMTVAFSDITLLLEKFFGTASPISASALTTLNPVGVACVLAFNNGLAGADTRSIVFTFANLFLNEETLPLDVNEVVKEDVTGWALSCSSIVWTNNTAVDSATP